MKKGRNFIVFRKSKIAFVHVPKAGSSTLKYIARYESRDIHEKFCPSDYECFCFVRNPFSRVYSSFRRFAIDLPPNRQAWKRQLQGHLEFIPFVKNRLESIRDWHFWSMKRFIVRASPDVRIYKFENFAESMKEILGHEVIHENMSSKPNYHQVYNDECVEIVSRLYKWDIDNLDYSF